jgi:sulfatase modifying factor 1
MRTTGMKGKSSYKVSSPPLRGIVPNPDMSGLDNSIDRFQCTSFLKSGSSLHLTNFHTLRYGNWRFTIQSLILILLIILSTSAQASAATVSWDNVGGGLWSESAKWSPARVPDSGDDVFINNAGAGTITVETTAAAKTLTVGGAKKMTLSTGQLTLSSTGDYTSANIGTLKYVPAGSFQRDATTENISTITTAFRMSRHEITQAQYVAVTSAANPSNFTGDNLPVEQVTWYDAVEFCNDLSTLEGLTPVYSITRSGTAHPITSATVTVPDWSANGYRLPTEMEWMWAAMGATSGAGYSSPTYLTGYAKPFAGSNATNAAGDDGTNDIGDYAWYSIAGDGTGENSYGTTHPVGTTGTTGHPNELGLYDMSGNVCEWVWDYADNGTWPYYAISGTVTDYRGAASGTYRVLRGGGWDNNDSYATVAVRVSGEPVDWSNDYGFRVVRP